MDLEKLRLGRKLTRCSDDWIKPLNVSDLKNAAARLCSVGQSARLFDCRSDGLFNEHIDSVLEKIYSYAGVIYGRYGETDRIDFSKQIAVISEWSGFVQCSDFFGSLFLDIDDAHQFHARK